MIFAKNGDKMRQETMRQITAHQGLTKGQMKEIKIVAKELKSQIRDIRRTAKEELKALKTEYKTLSKDLKAGAKEAKKRFLEMEERVHKMKDSQEATVDYGVHSPPAKRQVVSADGGSTSAPTGVSTGTTTPRPQGLPKAFPLYAYDA